MEEYISKEKVKGFVQSGISTDTEADKEYVCSFIDSIPSADVRENIHGHWGRLTRVEGVYSIDGVKTWGIKCQCDKCTFTTIVVEGFGFYDYCPHCGSRNEVEADMREPIGEKGTE